MRTRIISLAFVLVAGCVARPSEPAAAETTIRPDHPSEGWEFLHRDDTLDISSIDDAEVRKCLALIHKCPRPADSGNPASLVRAVNALIEQGHERALEILRTYHALRMAQSNDEFFDDYPSRVFTVGRIAFVSRAEDVPLRGGAIGGYGTVIRTGSVEWPQYPYVVFEGIPFDVSSGLMLGGVPEPPAMYLDRLEKEGVLRTTALLPVDNPLEAADRLFASAAWADIRFEGDEPGSKWFMSEDWLKMGVRRQALAAVSGFFTPDEDIRYSLSHTSKYGWDRHLAAVRALRPRWDIESQTYVSTR